MLLSAVVAEVRLCAVELVLDKDLGDLGLPWGYISNYCITPYAGKSQVPSDMSTE